MIIKHSKNVERCAWLGELDSAEESDEISNEFDFQQEVLHVDDEEEYTRNETSEDISDEDISKLGKAIVSEGSHELEKYLKNIQNWSESSRKRIAKRLLEQIVGYRTGDSLVGDALEPNLYKKKNETEGDLESSLEILADYTIGELKSRNSSKAATDRKKESDYNVKAVKDEDTGGEVDHFFNNGKFNQKNRKENKEDKSNEEVRSSWSSSEEALAACEGAIFNIPLDGATKCNENATFDEMGPIMSNISYLVDSTGIFDSFGI